MGRTQRTEEALHDEAMRHIAAVRAYHTGLVAESQKHLHVLAAFTRHVEVLREQRQAHEKLASLRACCQELAKLRRMREPWRDTYEDLRRSIVRARALFQRLAALSGRKRRRT